MNLLGKNLKDTPFSQDRLLIWAFGIVLVTAPIYVFILDLFEKPESRILNHAVSFTLGSASTAILNALTKGGKK